MRDLAYLVLMPSGYPALAELCIQDETFPLTFDSWLELVRCAERQAAAERYYPEPLLLEPEAFEGWCRRVAIMPGVDALRAYAIVQRRQLAAAPG